MTNNFTPVLYRFPCALTQAYSLDCRTGIGGSKSFWIIEFDNVSGITSSNGTISAIGKANNKRFWKYNQVVDTSEAKEVFAGDTQAGTSYWDQTVDIVLHKRQVSIRNEILSLQQVRVIIVEQDRNDKYWLYGETIGLQLGTGQSGSGKTAKDMNGYTLGFTGSEPQLAKEVSSSVIATLETP